MSELPIYDLTEAIVQRRILLNEWIEHLNGCTNCKTFDETTNLYLLRCAVGWLIRDAIRIRTDKIRERTY